MATTLLNALDEIQAGGPFSTTARSAGRLTRWFNDAQDWFIGARLWAWRETTTVVASVSGTGTYVLTGTTPIVTDFSVMISVTHSIAAANASNAPKLRFLSQQDFDDWFAVTSATAGPPIFYTLRGGTPKTTSATIVSGGEQLLSVWPVPNYIGSFSLRYFRSVDSCHLSADTDVTLVPQRFVPALIARATAYGLATTGTLGNSKELNAFAEEMLAQAIREDEQARFGDKAPGERPTMSGQLPADPSQSDPRVTPYGRGQAA